MSKWLNELRAMFPVHEEYDLAAAIYPFEAAFCQGLSPQQAYDKFDAFVNCEDDHMYPMFPPGFAT